MYKLIYHGPLLQRGDILKIESLDGDSLRVSVIDMNSKMRIGPHFLKTKPPKKPQEPPKGTPPTKKGAK